MELQGITLWKGWGINWNSHVFLTCPFLICQRDVYRKSWVMTFTVIRIFIDRGTRGLGLPVLGMELGPGQLHSVHL